MTVGSRRYRNPTKGSSNSLIAPSPFSHHSVAYPVQNQSDQRATRPGRPTDTDSSPGIDRAARQHSTDSSVGNDLLRARVRCACLFPATACGARGCGPKRQGAVTHGHTINSANHFSIFTAQPINNNRRLRLLYTYFQLITYLHN